MDARDRRARGDDRGLTATDRDLGAERITAHFVPHLELADRSATEFAPDVASGRLDALVGVALLARGLRERERRAPLADPVEIDDAFLRERHLVVASRGSLAHPELLLEPVDESSRRERPHLAFFVADERVRLGRDFVFVGRLELLRGEEDFALHHAARPLLDDVEPEPRFPRERGLRELRIAGDRRRSVTERDALVHGDLGIGPEEKHARRFVRKLGLDERPGGPLEVARELQPFGRPRSVPARAHATEPIEDTHERREHKASVRRSGAPQNLLCPHWIGDEAVDAVIGFGVRWSNMAAGNRLGELLVREKLISLQQLRQAQEEQKKTGGNLGYALAKLGYISDGEITNFLSAQYRVPAVNLDEYEFDPATLKLVSKEVCEKHKCIPISRSGNALIVAMADPTNLHAIDDIKFLTGFNVEPVVSSETGIAAAIDRGYNLGAAAYEDVLSEFADEEVDFALEEDDLNLLELEKQAEGAPVIRLVNAVLLNAIKKGASDIHVEPYEKKIRVRYRIDGVLIDEMQPPMKLKNAIASRLKIMASLDIAERRLPQDGRIKLKIGGGKEMDFRVSVLPTIWGEKIVLRLLDKGNLQLDMTKLGFDVGPLADFQWAIGQPWGMVLVTGPTGSGKTTTLYSALSDLNKPGHNICTAEDPVEYNLHGINQVQMHDEIGLNFAAALRSFLRQDPDIIMVGEIRDFETAEIAVKSALTGHLVLSTLHTNDAPSTISRLLNMGVEPFLITASVNLVLAQRLARKICLDCRTAVAADPAKLREFGFNEQQASVPQLLKGAGCKNCNGSGFKGRVALYEVMKFGESLKEMVLQGASTAELKTAAIKNGMKTLRMSGIEKILQGITTVEEVGRVTMGD